MFCDAGGCGFKTGEVGFPVDSGQGAQGRTLFRASAELGFKGASLVRPPGVFSIPPLCGDIRGRTRQNPYESVWSDWRQGKHDMAAKVADPYETCVTGTAPGRAACRSTVGLKQHWALTIVVLASAFVSGCVDSPANPGLLRPATAYSKHPTGDEQIRIGVVNGMYKYDPQKTRKQLDEYAADLSEAEREHLSTRYVVRVGFKRMPAGAVILPLIPGSLTNKASDYVLLPQGWVADPSSISSDDDVINIGDLVIVRVQAKRWFDYLDKVVRKCSDTPSAGEDSDWHIGCRTYTSFDSNGYIGERKLSLTQKLSA